MIKLLRSITKTLFVCLIFTAFSFGQSAEDITDSYSDYTQFPREIAYAHLNKSTYVEGEMLGFTAYLFDKYAKEPSQLTKNLYCTISDENGNVIKKKLLKVEDAIASNIFEIDSTLSTGIYTFKAYTNWMRNFKEPNHYEQTFKVIDADNLQQIKPINPKDLNIDLQVLGEGGRLSYNINNVIGIIAKNQFGLGIGTLKGRIIDNEDKLVANFELNEMGLAKTILNPSPQKQYFVEIDVFENTIKKEIKDIKPMGLSMMLNSLNNSTTIKLEANDLFYKNYGNQTFKLALHDGSDIKVTEFQLNDKGSIILSYPSQELFPGVNIFTLFTEDNKPLLERLCFNSKNIQRTGVDNVLVQRQNDSLDISLKLNNFDLSKWSNLSVSVLPSTTKSYNHHNNLLSQLFIQPYIKGYVENASQYFKNTRKSEYNLDLLLLTQGWSSYSWNDIFNYNDTYIYPFERGINIVGNINGDKPGTYVVYPMSQSSTQMFDLKQGENVFTIEEAYPTGQDLLKIGYIDKKKKGFRKKPTLSPQYFPSKFPDFDQSYNVPSEVFLSKITALKEVSLDKSWLKGETLDEVVVEGENRFTRAEALKSKVINSKVAIVSDREKNGGMRLDIYLQRLGFTTYFDILSGQLSITNPRVRGIGTQNPVPAVYLDGALIGFGPEADFGILTFIQMSDVDYIEYELYGLGGGLLQGEAGFIKIYTSPEARSRSISQNLQSYEIPLSFGEEKAFYVPAYKFYNTAFFNDYGTIDWIPKAKINNDGTIDLKVLNTKNDVILFIEGIVNDTHFISESLTIELQGD